MGSEEEEIYQQAYLAELEKLRIHEIESKARKDAQVDTARVKCRRRKKSAIGRYLQTKIMELAGGNKRFLDLTSQQLHIKIITLTKESWRLAKPAEGAEGRRRALYMECLLGKLPDIGHPTEFLSKEDAKILSDYESVKVELDALLREISLREKIKIGVLVLFVLLCVVGLIDALT